MKNFLEPLAQEQPGRRAVRERQRGDPGRAVLRERASHLAVLIPARRAQ
jgi:hypothetical protein